jgi:hypothetical protein
MTMILIHILFIAGISIIVPRLRRSLFGNAYIPASRLRYVRIRAKNAEGAAR